MSSAADKPLNKCVHVADHGGPCGAWTSGGDGLCVVHRSMILKREAARQREAERKQSLKKHPRCGYVRPSGAACAHRVTKKGDRCPLHAEWNLQQAAKVEAERIARSGAEMRRIEAAHAAAQEKVRRLEARAWDLEVLYKQRVAEIEQGAIQIEGNAAQARCGILLARAEQLLGVGYVTPDARALAQTLIDAAREMRLAGEKAAAPVTKRLEAVP